MRKCQCRLLLIRRNELQLWFIAEHVVDVPLAQTVTKSIEIETFFPTEWRLCWRPTGRAAGANNNLGRTPFPRADRENKCSFVTNNETAKG